MLQGFCQKIMDNFPYLFKSEEFKIFLTFQDVEKELSKLPVSYEEIMIRYKNSFVNIIDEKEVKSDESQGKINTFLNGVLLKAEKSIKVSTISLLFKNKNRILRKSLDILMKRRLWRWRTIRLYSQPWKIMKSK